MPTSAHQRGAPLQGPLRTRVREVQLGVKPHDRHIVKYDGVAVVGDVPEHHRALDLAQHSHAGERRVLHRHHNGQRDTWAGATVVSAEEVRGESEWVGAAVVSAGERCE